MTTIPKPATPTSTYTGTYDAWNRLVKVQDGETTVAEYQYDGQNRRTMKTVSGTARHFYYSSGWQVFEERVGASTNADCQYVWGQRYIDDLVLRDRDSDGNSGTGSLGKSGSGLDERLYALQDANYNVVALAESDGDIVTRYRYTAYGDPTPLNPNFTAPYTGTDYAWPYLYTARREDPETGLMYYRNRYYHTGLGTFVTRDPTESDLNLYRYCGDNPLVYGDPTGEDWLDCMAACIEDNDPVNLVLEAAIAQLSVGLWPKEMFAKMAEALGDKKLANAIRASGGIGQKLTTMPKGLLTLLRSKPGAGLNTVLKYGGKTLGRLNIAYGLYLAAAEVHCLGYCCTASILGIPYSSQDGRMKKSIEDFYSW